MAGIKCWLPQLLFSDMLFNSDMSLLIDRLTIQAETDKERIAEAEANATASQRQVKQLKHQADKHQEQAHKLLVLVAEVMDTYDHLKAKNSYQKKMLELAKYAVFVHRQGGAK